MNKIILALVGALVIYTAHALELNKDCDGHLCNVEQTQQK